MLKNYLKTAWRNLMKNKFYAAINIFGLAFGLAICLLILLYVFDELSYDRYNLRASDIYRVNTEIRFGGNYFDGAVCDAPQGPAMKRELPDVEQFMRFRYFGDILVKKGTENLRESSTTYVDSTLFRVFTLPLLSGDPKTALTEPRTVVITAKMAKKYFGRMDVLGQSLQVNDSQSYKITGVLKDVPTQSHFNYDFYFPMTQNEDSRSDEWLSENYNTYILVRRGADPKKLALQIDQLLDRYIGPEIKNVINQTMDEFRRSGNFIRTSLTPVTDIHLHSNKLAELGPNGNIQYVYIFSAVAVLILLIACVNFMNLSTARAASRSKEVGVRKVLGSQRKNLVQQFLTESVLMSLLALVLAIGFAILMLPYFEKLASKQISIRFLFQPGMWISFVVLVGMVGFLAGSYPAFYLSAFHPIQVLKGRLAEGFKRSWLRNVLVVFQFSISIILIVSTLVIYNQLMYIRKADVGFNRYQVLVLSGTNVLGDGVRSLKDEILKISGVKGVTVTGFLPVNGYTNNDTWFPTTSLDIKTAISAREFNVDEHYIPTLELQILKGRNFSPQFPTDSSGLIINEAAAKFLGEKGSLGSKLYQIEDIKTKKLNEFHVIGIVKNFNISSLRDAITPVFMLWRAENSKMSVRLSGTSANRVVDEIRSKWKAMVPGQPFEYAFMDDQFNHLYATEQQTGEIFINFAVLAIFIGCLGLFGLATYAAEQRTKEIGIRKILGASVSRLAGMLSKDFLNLIMLSMLIAFPIGWFAMNKWLQGFAYRISISWWVFLAAGTCALVIAILTVSFQAIKAALASPVKNLRSE